MPLLENEIPRYTVSANWPIQVAVARKGSLPRVPGGQLVDITEIDARFSLPEMLNAGELIAIEISTQDRTLDRSLAGAVTWARPEKNLSGWLIRCRFDKKIDSAELERLLELRILERRRGERFAMPVQSTARWEGLLKPCDSLLVDVSVGGFSFTAATAGAVGGLVQLTINLSDFQGRLDGRICWTKPEDGAFRMGCQFLEKSPPIAMRLIEMASAQDASGESGGSDRSCQHRSLRAKIARLFGRKG